MPSFISSARFGLGLGMMADGSMAKVNDIDPMTHNFIRYGREAQVAKIIAGVGMGFFNDFIGAGVSMNANFSGEGAVALEDVEMSTDAQVPSAQAKMDLKMNPAIIAGVYLSPGKLLPMFDGFDLGVSYRMESYMEIAPFETAASIPSTLAMRMEMAIFDYYSPHIFTAGVSYKFWIITISADVEYHMWSKYKVSEAQQIVAQYNVEEDGEDYALPDAQDIIVPKAGIEISPFDWVSVMGGFYLQPAIFPDEANKGKMNFLDNTKYVGSAGLNFKIPQFWILGGSLEISLAYQYQYLETRDVVKDDQSPDDYLKNPDYSYGGVCHTAIVSVMMKI